ncbi:hypothetical protein JJB09_06325 [Rhizobium sp. KVB221]|uniref:Glyoxalase-related protein domain-containing protein n=2 Tax=Rhizobium setariae TaxID=2801340 RepID=A0A936YS56_9HYPH|nr:glyoxalase superfamily protein [Rhizobium setariae]MBL0371637.1 hypothetical protein [Rhizobium setariae]
MGDTSRLPSLDDLKDQAKRLRDALARQGTTVNHSKALELVASQYGFRDWNTLHASLGNSPPKRTLTLGDRVNGRYLGQDFKGQVVAVQTLTSAHGMTRVTFDFDEPVDVVTFDSFSAYRKRVTCTLDADGRTVEKTSNGEPHMVLG